MQERVGMRAKRNSGFCHWSDLGSTLGRQKRREVVEHRERSESVRLTPSRSTRSRARGGVAHGTVALPARHRTDIVAIE